MDHRTKREVRRKRLSGTSGYQNRLLESVEDFWQRGKLFTRVFKREVGVERLLKAEDVAEYD